MSEQQNEQTDNNGLGSCPQCGKPIITAVPRKIIQRDNRAPRGIRQSIKNFCSQDCGAYHQMGCEG